MGACSRGSRYTPQDKHSTAGQFTGSHNPPQAEIRIYLNTSRIAHFTLLGPSPLDTAVGISLQVSGSFSCNLFSRMRAGRS